ncbi:MAG: hypothetical protein JWQ40_1714 [Segetibacter sp.]|jgi:hypothetical protein|nr:hypothetical protein [Segetibacter sp.]
MDIIVAEARKGDQEITLEDVEAELKADGRI